MPEESVETRVRDSDNTHHAINRITHFSSYELVTSPDFFALKVVQEVRQPPPLLPVQGNGAVRGKYFGGFLCALANQSYLVGVPYTRNKKNPSITPDAGADEDNNLTAGQPAHPPKESPYMPLVICLEEFGLKLIVNLPSITLDDGADEAGDLTAGKPVHPPKGRPYMPLLIGLVLGEKPRPHQNWEKPTSITFDQGADKGQPAALQRRLLRVPPKAFPAHRFVALMQQFGWSLACPGALTAPVPLRANVQVFVKFGFIEHFATVPRADPGPRLSSGGGEEA
ncbi:hypothetical protein C8R46DRAFT_1048029 [Mycena filopes]|nr:hypothetical protein C8R46DRAFT_1048029 [Mycena filopes]